MKPYTDRSTCPLVEGPDVADIKRDGRPTRSSVRISPDAKAKARRRQKKAARRAGRKGGQRVVNGSPSPEVRAFAGMKDYPRKVKGCMLGADDVSGDVFVSLKGIEPKVAPVSTGMRAVWQAIEGDRPIIGILVVKNGPADANLFGYWPCFPSDFPGDGGFEQDDAHHSLSELCRNYGLPLGKVIDRIALELLRQAQRAPAEVCYLCHLTIAGEVIRAPKGPAHTKCATVEGLRTEKP